MFCIYCGAEMNDDAKYCPNCGAKVAEDLGGAPKAGKAGRISFGDVKEKVNLPDPSAVFAKVKNAVPAGETLVSAGSFSTMDKVALGAAVLSVIFAICSIKVYMTWLTLIAAIGLALLCFVRQRFDSMPMAVPVSLFALTVLISSVRVFRYLKYYKFLAAALVILPLIFSIGAAIVYWMMVIKGDSRNLVVAEVVLLAGYALLSITSVLTGGAGTFRLVASRLTAILFAIAYIMRILETSSVFAPMGADGGTWDGGDYVHYDHPYQKLGGYLAFTVYGGIVVSVLAIIGMIVTMIPIFKALKYLSRYGNMSFLYIIAIILILFAIVLYGLIIKLMIMIKNKNQKFLWFYHKVVIAETLVTFVLQWITSGFGQGLVYLIFYALMFFLYTLYFVKSVRVRTYMQSDEYLRIDPLTRNVPSPRPADMEPFMGS